MPISLRPESPWHQTPASSGAGGTAGRYGRGVPNFTAHANAIK